MVQIVWQFKVAAGREPEFEIQYGQTGGWVRLFKQAPGYCGTVLLRGGHGQYLTIDTWDSLESFEEFKAGHQDEYELLDQRCARLTERETLVGLFEAVS